jgi:histidinol-phosphatase (PHP family)
LLIDRSSDYHIHSFYSDGDASIDAMARSAANIGLKQVTITDHMPLPFNTRYAMPRVKVEAYRRDIRQAQKTYDGRLNIKSGIEFEFIPRYREWIHDLWKMGWDHCIVSVHRLFDDNIVGMVNGTRREFDALFQMANFDIKTLCRLYYDVLQIAYRTGWFDIAGHLDVIKKHNTNSIFFDESDAWYRDLVVATLRVIKDCGMKMEINTAGINHPVSTPYPSSWIVYEAAAMGIPMVLGSDSHNSGTLGQYFDSINKWYHGFDLSEMAP